MDGSAAEPGCGQAVQTMRTSAPNLVALNVDLRPRSSLALSLSEVSRSDLLRTTMRCCTSISPSTRHSAVCVWMPLVQSMTSSMTSMMAAPPIMVRNREAWPGQSTRV